MNLLFPPREIILKTSFHFSKEGEKGGLYDIFYQYRKAIPTRAGFNDRISLPVLKSISAVLKENFWVLLACVFAIIISFLFTSCPKEKAEEIIENKVIEIDPFEEAFEKMKLLAESSPRLAAKPFIFKLSEIIRLFIERQFKIPALEQTGEEFLEEYLSTLSYSKSLKNY